MSVDPELRLLGAMNDLLSSAEALATDPEDSTAARERQWALRLATRSLHDAGGMPGLTDPVRSKVNDLGRRVTEIDRRTQRTVEARLSRLRHSKAENRSREGTSSLGLCGDTRA